MTSLVPPRPSRSLWQLAYGAAHRARRGYWVRRAHSLPVPVVSVGNLLWGGGGKTPLVAAIAEHLAAAGRRPAILSRGWGRNEPKSIRIVSEGLPGRAVLGAPEAGDEPALLARLLPTVPVIVGADRHAAGMHALGRLEARPDLFLLDDGFSHLRLRRDLDLLALPASDPFGGGRLAPSGRLREPLSAVARADAAILTSAPDGATGADLQRELAPFGFTGRGFTSATRSQSPPAIAATARVYLVAAVANPQNFLAAVRSQGLAVVGQQFFRDHYRYPDSSLERIVRGAVASGADAILVTSKDMVKLDGRFQALTHLPVLELAIRAEPEPEFWPWLDSRL